MEIKKGDTFKCIKTVVTTSGEKTYLEGRHYVSEKWGCITNEKGNKDHVWIFNGDVDLEEFEEHFERTYNTVYISQKGIKNDMKKLPYYTVLFKQFPNAIREVVKCSAAGHNKYLETDEDWQNFSRLDNADIRYKEAMLRHMLEDGSVQDMEEYGGMTHEGAVVWNALANLEIKLRKNEK